MIAEGVSNMIKTALMVMIGSGGGAQVVKKGLTARMKHHGPRMRRESGVLTARPEERVVSLTSQSEDAH